MIQSAKNVHVVTIGDDYFSATREPVFSRGRAYPVLGEDPRSTLGNPLIRVQDDSGRERVISGRYLERADR